MCISLRPFLGYIVCMARMDFNPHFKPYYLLFGGKSLKIVILFAENWSIWVVWRYFVSFPCILGCWTRCKCQIWNSGPNKKKCCQNFFLKFSNAYFSVPIGPRAARVVRKDAQKRATHTRFSIYFRSISLHLRVMSRNVFWGLTRVSALWPWHMTLNLETVIDFHLACKNTHTNQISTF